MVYSSLFSRMVCFLIVFSALCSTSFPNTETKIDIKTHLQVFSDYLSTNQYIYAYPRSSSVSLVNSDWFDGGTSLNMELSARDYSGAGISFPRPADLSHCRKNGYLEFWIKADRKIEECSVRLVNQGVQGKTCEVVLPLKSFINGTQAAMWQRIYIPLSSFPETGFHWTGTEMVPQEFNWHHVRELKFTSDVSRGDVHFNVDEIRIVTDLTAKRSIESLIYKDNDIIRQDTAKEGCYLGVFTEGIPVSMKGIESFEHRIGKKAALIFWYQDWSKAFPSKACAALSDKKYTPCIFWEPWLLPARIPIQLTDILGGRWDDYIMDWAVQAKAFGRPLLIIWGHESNGTWYPWSVYHNNKDPELYRETYRYIHTLFALAGADNVQWVWCVNHTSIPDEPWNDMTKTYPGDQYVDWIGINGYNTPSLKNNEPWQSFDDIFSQAYTHLTEMTDSKPVMIAECGTSGHGPSKASWYKDISATIPQKYPRIRCINWFDVVKEADYRIYSSPASLKAFQTLARNPYFLTQPQGLLSAALSARPKAPRPDICVMLPEEARPLIEQIEADPQDVRVPGKIEKIFNLCKKSRSYHAFMAYLDYLLGLEDFPFFLHIKYYKAKTLLTYLTYLADNKCWKEFHAFKKGYTDTILKHSRWIITNYPNHSLALNSQFLIWQTYCLTHHKKEAEALETLFSMLDFFTDESQSTSLWHSFLEKDCFDHRTSSFKRLVKHYLALIEHKAGTEAAIEACSDLARRHFLSGRYVLSSILDTEYARYATTFYPEKTAAALIENIGNDYFFAGRKDLSEPFFRVVTEKLYDRQNPAHAHARLALCYEAKEQLKKAIKQWKYVTILYKDTAYCELGLFRMGNDFAALGDTVNAVRCFSALLLSHPESLYAACALYDVGIKYMNGHITGEAGNMIKTLITNAMESGHRKKHENA